MKFGLHVSIAAGVQNSPGRAKDAGCDCFQIFAANPRSWKFPAISQEDVQAFRQNMQECGLDTFAIHATYLPNPATPKPELWDKSYEHLLAQYRAGRDLGAMGFVLHPGSGTGAEKSVAMENCARCLKALHEECPDGPAVLLENTAGGGQTLGRTLEELAGLLELAALPEQSCGICFDSCHALAAGIDVRKKGAMARFVKQADESVFPGCIKLLHLNDSQGGLESNRDRHCHIGRGEIGEDGMRSILRTRALRSVPVVLETPEDEVCDDAGNLAAAREFAGC